MRMAMAAAVISIAGSPCFGGIYQDCEEAVKAGDQKRAQEISETIMRFNSVTSPEDQVAGAACLTFATGKPHVYSPQLGTFAPADEQGELILEAQKANAEQQRKKDQLEAERLAAELAQEAAASEIERRRQERIQAVWVAVGAACFELYRDDVVQALTNKTCVDVFLETGLPE